MKAGWGARRGEQPAIAFVDLTGYTELTASAGDERAAQFASTLQTLAATSARANGGRIVKLLGDGVMLCYPSLGAALRSGLALMRSMASAGPPPPAPGGVAGTEVH